MGRMASSRKRTSKDAAAPRRATAPRARSARSKAAAGPTEVPKTTAGRAGRITLPPSGLAEDILTRDEARTIEATPPQSAIEPAPSAPPARAESFSFLMAPAREEKKPVEATEHLVTFLLGEEEYGLDVRLVQEIIRLTEITPVPRAPEYVKGVINLRGRIIPVVDLKRKLGLGEVDPAARGSRIVVTKVRERLVGLLVDGASQVLKIPVSVIEPAPEEVVEVDVDYIRGVAKMDNRLIILMDLSRTLSLEAREIEAGAPTA
jgi:purine-binding chemotaxis protein CheW